MFVRCLMVVCVNDYTKSEGFWVKPEERFLQKHQNA